MYHSCFLRADIAVFDLPVPPPLILGRSPLSVGAQACGPPTYTVPSTVLLHGADASVVPLRLRFFPIRNPLFTSGPPASMLNSRLAPLWLLELYKLRGTLADRMALRWQ